MNRIITPIKTIINHKVFQNFMIIGIIAVFQLINNIILGRCLSKDEFGQYTFAFFSIVGVLSIVLLFGHNYILLRYFSSKDFLDYQWKKYLLNKIVTIIPILIFIMLTINLIYKLNWFWFWMSTITIYISCCTNLMSALLRAKGYFNLSTILERAHPIFYSFILLILYFCYNSLNVNSAAISRLATFSLQIPVIIFFLIFWKEGTLKIQKNIFKDNLNFLELNISTIIITNIDSFFIAKMLSFKDLALFSITMSILQIFEFGKIALLQVYSQKFSRETNINIIRFKNILLSITIILFIFYLTSANFLLNILFNGKYSLTLMQLFLFCVYSSINFLYILPSCYAIGQSSSKDLKFMLGVNISCIIIKIFLILFFARYSISGFLVAGIITQFIRTAFGYYMVFKNYNMKWKMFFKLKSESLQQIYE